MDTPTRDCVKAALINEILGMEVGERLLPERQLAVQHQVSRSTMSRIMAELVREGYLARRSGSGTFVLSRLKPVRLAGSTPNAQGELLLVYPDFFAYSIWSIVHAIEAAAARENYRLLSIKMQQKSDYKAILELIKECGNLRGILIQNSDHYSDFFWKKVDALGIPVVLFGMLDSLEQYRNIHCFSGDHHCSGEMKVRILLEAGHRQIGWIPNEPATPAYHDCVRGMKQALQDAGMHWANLARPGREAAVFWSNPFETGYNLTKELLAKNPGLTALIVDTLPAAFGALRAIADAGLKCPDDVSLITSQSFDRLEEFSIPRLSTLEASQLPQIELLMEIIRNGGAAKRLWPMPPTLRMRESIRTLPV